VFLAHPETQSSSLQLFSGEQCRVPPGKSTTALADSVRGRIGGDELASHGSKWARMFGRTLFENNAAAPLTSSLADIHGSSRRTLK
jgi:hypothetical protein